MKVFTAFSAILLLCSCAVAAGQTDGMFPNVKEHNLDRETYRLMYEKIDPSQAAAKLIVFSREGECVGVTGPKTTHPEDMVAFITSSLRKNHKACKIVVASHLGVKKVGAQSGTGRPEVQLILLGGQSCKACEQYKMALLTASHGALANMDLSIRPVQFNAGK